MPRPLRISVIVACTVLVSYGILLLSVAHAYPGLPWSSLLWTTLRVSTGIIVGAAVFAFALVAWARAK